jgi:hypothetical protein
MEEEEEEKRIEGASERARWICFEPRLVAAKIAGCRPATRVDCFHSYSGRGKRALRFCSSLPPRSPCAYSSKDD